MEISWYLFTLQWRHNGRDGVSNHKPHDCLLNRLFKRRSKKHQSSASLAFVRRIHRWPMNSLHKWTLLSAVRERPLNLITHSLPAQMASNAESVSIWWRHHDIRYFCVHKSFPNELGSLTLLLSQADIQHTVLLSRNMHTIVFTFRPILLTPF